VIFLKTHLSGTMRYSPWDFTPNNLHEGGGNGDWKTIDTDLGNYAFTTFVKLSTGTNAAETGKAFTEAYKKARNGESNASFQLQNLADIHLISADGNNGALRMVQIFMLVVVLLLVIASINYVNLSTARSLIRAKEVSIRKIIGAKKQQLFFQFVVETILLFCLCNGARNWADTSADATLQ
jgi:putative ABC transport system permease protein